jgi:uncharacterized membrane-anchored protein YitT (DUF2179 family)
MKKFKDFLLLNLGLLLVAIGIYYFLVPNNLAAGGVSGLAMVITQYLPSIPIGLLMLGMNFVLFILAFFLIGREFAVKTVYSSFALSGMIWLLELIYPMSQPILTDDLFIQLIFGILISAIGMAIVFNMNGSTGGTDIIAKIFNKYFHLPIGKGLLAADFFITLFAAITFGPKIGMYAILGVMLNGFAIDLVIEGFNIVKQLVIITSRTEDVKKFIIDELGRGATVYAAKGAYSGDEKEVITTIVSQKEFVRLKNYVKSIDPEAFITVSNVHEALGEGFK